jgi:hypothetical protein
MSRISAGFKNNVNIITIRAFGSTNQLVTDRAIDFDGDGEKEKVTIATVEGAGNKTVQTVTEPAGVRDSIVSTVVEPDGGSLDTEGNEHTEGLE